MDKKKGSSKEKKILILIASVSVFINLLLIFFAGFTSDYDKMGINAKMDYFISIKEDIQKNLLSEGYRCCLEKPCTYCLFETSSDRSGAQCNCLEEIVNGEPPCGECIGEILEGNGNKFLSKYFATAIANEVGENHIDGLREIMYEKYGIPVEEQL